MTHLVRRQYVHLELKGTEAQGLAVQRSLSRIYQHALLPAFELVLDRYIPSGLYLSIERLDVDAGTIPLERLEDEFARTAAQVLERSLKEVIPSGGIAPSHKTNKIRRQTEHQHLEELFVYFLEYGSLPWSARLQKGNTLEQSLLDAWQRDEGSGYVPLAATELVRRTLLSSRAQKRLVRQFSTHFLETLLIRLLSESRSEIREALHGLVGELLRIEDAKVLRYVLWETLFAYAAEGREKPATDFLVEVSRIVQTASRPEVSLERLMEGLRQSVTDKAEEIQRSLSSQEKMPSPAEGPNNSYVQPDNTQSTVNPAVLGSDVRIVPPSSPNTVPNADEHPDLRQGLYIENAGLVLLHPFLPQLFSALRIADDGNLVLPERALCLLHYLSSGQTMAPEYELTLPKILCNIPLGMPVERDVELSCTDQEEGMALLEAVIRHWDALRNTSPDGLRANFLLRPGKVSQQDDGDWQLQVETNTSDILLDQLPWGISTIKLPWMRKILWVEWR